MKKFSIILLLAAFLLQGCASYRRIALVDVEFGNVKMTALTKARVQVNLKINNPTRSVFYISNLEGILDGAGTEFARFSLVEEIAVQPGEPSLVPATIAVEVTDPLALLAKGLNLPALMNGDFTVDAAVQVRKGAAKKWFRVKDIPLKELLENLNV
jgi:hypothetical protein